MVTGSSLQLEPVATPAELAAPAREALKATRDSPANIVFTNLSETPAITVAATTEIDRALNRMIDTGVRFLFVVDAGGGLVGSISSYDIAGEKPIRFLQARGGHFNANARADVLVRDIMAPIETWRVLDSSIARRATVGEIADALERTGLTHLVVVSPGRAATLDRPGIPARVEGLFSATRIERALGAALALADIRHTFADIEQALSHE